ncbi:MAG: hypothetical protein A4E32_00989 [Methanomassiliicoccales archaeon PtaU1.Bin124]|nr:MAG: hypothetical protein A4E32_00989 [Methanomassiliicoccales archaeon PtaU1.Bin124]
MTEESNVHAKVAMADVLALFGIAMFTMAVAGFGLAANGHQTLALVANIGMPVAIICLIATVMAFLNENLLGTAIFGPLAIFFLSIVLVTDPSANAWLCMVIGIIILVDAIVAFAQPVKLLPILLIVAAIAFFVTSVFYDSLANGKTGEDYRAMVGALWLIYSLISFYMAAAIMLLVMKGKQVLPLLIKA